MSRLVLPGEIITRAGNLVACFNAITHGQRGEDDKKLMLVLCEQAFELIDALKKSIEEIK